MSISAAGIVASLRNHWSRFFTARVRTPSSLRAATVIICFVHLHLVSANTITNSNSSASSSPLPSLTERAGNVNSRYLSAGSTASLAAATLAASANQQTSAQSGASTTNGSGSQSNLLHQHGQQHQHQQQQQQHNGQQQQGANSQHVPSQSVAVQQQQPQQPQQQQPVAGGNIVSFNQVAQQTNQANNPTPVMSSTYTYNPLTGQYSVSAPDVSQIAQSIGLANANNYLTPQQQQQQLQQYQALLLGTSGAQLSNPLNAQPNTLFSAPHQTTFGNISPRQRPLAGYPFVNAAGLSNNQQQSFYQQQPVRYQSAFTRRNGLVRPQSNYLGNGIDDEQVGTNGFAFQQTGGSIADQLAASMGLSLDPAYTNGLPSPSNVYLQQQQNGNQLQDLAQANPTSGSSVSAQHLSHLPGHVNQQQHQFSNAAAALEQQQQRSDQQCIAADGRHGTCYQASECIRRGGTPMGRCASGGFAEQTGFAASLSSGGGPSSSVCCLFDVTCGQFAAERFVYFRNPGYPTNSYDQSRMCRAKIGKLDKGVCQFRLDMLRFDIAKPTNGNCSQDMFVVSGQNENYVIPKICGFNDGQHYYVGVDESGVITLHMMMMGYYRRSFEILITQIPCRSDYSAPAHCLQYFVGTHGTIKSFNYDEDYSSASFNTNGQNSHVNNNNNNNQAFVNYDLQQDGSSTISGAISPATAPYGLQILQRQQQQQLFTAPVQSNNRFALLNDPTSGYQYGGYPNDLDYTICIRKESGFCSVTYQLSRTGDQGASAPFAVGQSFFGNHSDGGWHSVSTDCRDDYLLIGGVRLCSSQSSNSYDSYSQQQFHNVSSIGGHLQQQQQQLLLQQQQLQNQQLLLMQQLARLQSQTNGNVSLTGSIPLGGGQQQMQQIGVNSSPNGQSASLEQQQQAVVQQLMLVQQQLGGLAASTGALSGQQQQFGSYQPDLGQNAAELQNSIITDTTSGPFLLRFVSNNARNARGFHIDYRQNPCK